MYGSTVQTSAAVVTRGRPNPLHYGLPKRLRAAREAADLGTAQLSIAAGLAHPVAADIERGKVPHLSTVEKLARVLRLSPCWLVYGMESPPIAGDLACEAIGVRLQQAREIRAVSRKALGKLAGLSTTSISNIEAKGYTPTVATCEALAKALRVDPCWLGYGQGQAPQLAPTT